MFDPVSQKCIEKKRLPVYGKCNMFKECVILNRVSPLEKWYETKCEEPLHFDPVTSECIEPSISECGKRMKF